MALVYRFRYRDQGTGRRPYLHLHLTGPSGRPYTVAGLVDSGADVTALPLWMAVGLGYQSADLESHTALQVAGTVESMTAKRPTHARVLGAPGLSVELFPSFVPGSEDPLWGRADFFRAARVLIDEVGQEFALLTG